MEAFPCKAPVLTFDQLETPRFPQIDLPRCAPKAEALTGKWNPPAVMKVLTVPAAAQYL